MDGNNNIAVFICKQATVDVACVLASADVLDKCNAAAAVAVADAGHSC